MTKNTIGGKGHKKSKNNNTITKHVPLKQEGCEYGRVKDLLGNGRLRVITFNDNKERIGHIRGNMYKKVWIVKEDIVLVSLRDFQDSKCDIIYKYESDDVKFLIKRGEIQIDSDIPNEDDIIFDDQVKNIDNKIKDIDIDDI